MHVSDRWQQVKQILHGAVERPADERIAYVAEASGGDAELEAEVRSLLESFEEAEEFLEEPPLPLRPNEDALVGRWVSEYKVESLIASGGMGSVYLATKELDGFPMKVALKVIRFSGNTHYAARRFRLERQILARLNHENILRLLDGGVTPEGVPYLVTEYLEGKNLEEWLAERNPSVITRLELFQKICDGVAYAHRNLIVHGDLKPSNIVITQEGVPKLLDFGIARLLQTEEAESGEAPPTLTMAPALTPWWASPEQLRGEPLGIESDCYALGRILFFLLAGQPPFDLKGLTTQQILERLKKEAPPKPSAVSGDASLEGDLDNIARKALEFEKEHRYRTVDALGDDVQRYLDMRPVSARAFTLRYRFEKFIRRNRALAAIVTLATLVLSLAVGVALYQAAEARRNYEEARQRFEQLRRLANTLVFDADNALSTLQGATPVRARLVKSALGYLDELSQQSGADLQLREEVASAYEKIGDIQGRPGTSNLGQVKEALESYRKSEAIREEIRKRTKRPLEFQEASDRLATTYARLSAALRTTGDTEGALAYERKALGIRQALFEGDPGNVSRKRALASSLTTLSNSLSQMGDWDGVLESRREALKMFEELAAMHPDDPADQRGYSLALTRMASIEMHQEHFGEALKYYSKAFDVDLAIFRKDPGNVLHQLALGMAHSNLGVIEHRLGRLSEALGHFRRGREFYEAVVRADEKEVRSRSLLQTNRINTAKVLLQVKSFGDALKMSEKALEERKHLAAANPLNAGAQGEVAEAHSMLGQIYREMGRREAAVAELKEAAAILEGLELAKRSNAAMREELDRVKKLLAGN